MKQTPMSRVLSCLCALALAGCATPRPALDQANNGAALMASLQAELAKLRKTQATVAQLRLDSVRQQRALIASYEVDATFGERVQAAAGRMAQAQLAATLRELADSRALDEKALQEKMAALDEFADKLLSPVPDQAPKLSAAQQAIGALGQELSFEQRLKLAADFAAELNKTIEENKAKIDAAAAAAPTAPHQLASPSAVAGSKTN